MTGSVRILLVALPCLRVIARSVTCVDVRLIGHLKARRAEVTAQTVIGVVRSLVDVKRQVLEGAIRNTTVVTNTISSEARIRIENGRFVEGRYIQDFFPVGLRAGVVALSLEKDFVGAHVKMVPWEEGSLGIKSIVEPFESPKLTYNIMDDV